MLASSLFPSKLLDKSLSSNPGEAFALSLTAVERQKASTKWHPLHTALCVETRSFLPNILCNHLGDRSEMAHSIEGRVPFLDNELYERPKVRFLAPPSEFDPEGYHWKKIKSRVTQEAVERLGWMDWSFVDILMTRFIQTNDRIAQDLLNIVMSFIVIQERVASRSGLDHRCHKHREVSCYVKMTYTKLGVLQSLNRTPSSQRHRSLHIAE
ncbi:hypothetical protein AC1031_009000 [Aphanomyces cochlioides]|nr:hypothetical protein AC1031_009000 [Aphanomyces cochlioides]